MAPCDRSWCTCSCIILLCALISVYLQLHEHLCKEEALREEWDPNRGSFVLHRSGEHSQAAVHESFLDQA